MSDQEKTYNLTEMANRLSSEGRNKELVGKIRRILDMGSIRADLFIARDTLDAIESIRHVPSNPEKTHRELMVAAMLSHAILHYARATKTTSKERRPFEFRDKLTNEQEVVHDELCDLRDHAIAHFGSGGSYLGDWKRDTVFTHWRGSTARVGTISRRQTVDVALMQRARVQIGVAIEIIEEAFGVQSEVVCAAIRAELDADGGFAKEILQHEFDLANHFRVKRHGGSAERLLDEAFAQGNEPDDLSRRL